MHTDIRGRMEFRALGLLGILAVVVGFALWLDRPALSPALAARSPEPSPVVHPDDVARLGTVVVAAREEASISEDEALQTHLETDAYRGHTPCPFLVRVTLEDTLTSDEPIHDRLVWLFRYDDLAEVPTVPMLPDGSPADPGPVLQYGYVLVDATTGDWLRGYLMAAP